MDAGRITRRRMLKRLGAGAAVAWSAPILTSIRTPAFAQYPSGCAPSQAFCGTQDPSCGPTACPELCRGAPGYCSALDDGSCFCWIAGACFSSFPICQSDSDCRADFGRCITTAPCGACAGNRACIYCGPQPRSMRQHEDVIVVTAG
jgi:hypothetical protein